MSRLGRAGEDPPGVSCLELARERRAEVPLFQRQFWDSSIPSGAGGLAVNVVGWHGQEPRRFEPAAPEQGWQVRSGSWRVAPKAPPQRTVWAFCIPVQGLAWGNNSTPTAGRNWVPAAVTSRSRTRQKKPMSWVQGGRYFGNFDPWAQNGHCRKMSPRPAPALGRKHWIAWYLFVFEPLLFL